MRTQPIAVFDALLARAQGETIEELRGTVQALAAQLEELRVTVSSQQSTTSPNDSPSWSEIVRKKTHGHKPSKGGNEGRSEHSSHGTMEKPNKMMWVRVARIGENGVHTPTDLALLIKNSVMVSPNPNLDLSLKSLPKGNLYLVNGRYGAP